MERQVKEFKSDGVVTDWCSIGIQRKYYFEYRRKSQNEWRRYYICVAGSFSKPIWAAGLPEGYGTGIRKDNHRPHIFAHRTVLNRDLLNHPSHKSRQKIETVDLQVTTIVCSIITHTSAKIAAKCEGGAGLKYLWGDALSDPSDCLGPNNMPYPSAAISRTFRSSSLWTGSARTGRSAKRTIDPFLTRRALLAAHEHTMGIENTGTISRTARAAGTSSPAACSSTPSRLCKTRYNTTAPMYGVSLTSGQPVTIVQKFPDLLQQVVFEVCESSECDVVRGECTQTYVPYLFLVIPLGPVTLTGQDYVLVESGCVCRPKYASQSNQEASAMASIPRL
ncbi:hypothetical protein ILUMI_02363 [Ignelater luminosus]|uniref:Uncharacterized protein n=1 Tax=Ignelater luminosus TaxID=2038154 RepID=A0A8K0GLF1_IGNLU|nr:hypothetical protein ILUMI_02363 [Ignelater luminosus]